MPTSEHVDPDRQLIEQCVVLLQEHRGEIDAAVAGGEQHADDVKELYTFCCDGMQTVVAMLDEGLNSVWAVIISRTILETSIRLLWTVSAADGWERQILRWASERQRWAKKILEIDPDQADAGETLAACDEVLSGLEGYERQPDALNQILDDFDDEQMAGSAYAFLYKTQCEPVHGGVAAVAHSLKNPGAHASQASAGCVYATQYLLRAVFRFCKSSDPPNDLKERLGRILSQYPIGESS